MIVSPESLRECPNGLFVTTVDGRFDARGMPARPSEQSDTGLDDHPLRTPSLNVALRVQKVPAVIHMHFRQVRSSETSEEQNPKWR